MLEAFGLAMTSVGGKCRARQGAVVGCDPVVALLVIRIIQAASTML